MILYLSATGNIYKDDIILIIFCQNVVYLSSFSLQFLVPEEQIFYLITALIYSGYLSHVWRTWMKKNVCKIQSLKINLKDISFILLTLYQHNSHVLVTISCFYNLHQLFHWCCLFSKWLWNPLTYLSQWDFSHIADEGWRFSFLSVFVMFSTKLLKSFLLLNCVWVCEFLLHVFSGSSLSPPVLTVFPPSSAELQSNQATLVCLSRLSVPWADVSWLLGDAAVSSGISTSTPVQQADQTFQISSHLTIQTSDWNAQKVYTCKVSVGSQTAEKRITKSECEE